MDKRDTLKHSIISTIVVICLIFAATSIAFAGGPQPRPGREGGPEVTGKAVDGLYTAILVKPGEFYDTGEILLEVDEQFVLETITIICKQAQVVLGPGINEYSDPINFSKLTAEGEGDPNDPSNEEFCLEGNIIGDQADDPPQSQCFPVEGVEIGFDDIVITRVRSFTKTDTTISAEVTLMLGRE